MRPRRSSHGWRSAWWVSLGRRSILPPRGTKPSSRTPRRSRRSCPRSRPVRRSWKRMDNGIVSKAPQIIQVESSRLSISQIVNYLRDYHCPQKIIEKIEEWIFDIYLDREKLRRWKESCREGK